MGKLTDVAVKNAKPIERRQEVPDGDGLYLIVQPSGAKSWALRYRMPGSTRLLKHTLGTYPDWTLKAAREKASELRRGVSDKTAPVDPQALARTLAAERARGALETFQAVAVSYLGKRSGLRSVAEKARLLGLRLDAEGTYQIIKGDAAGPCSKWGSRPFTEVSRSDIRAYLEAMAERAPVQANRAHAELSAFYAWAVGRDLLPVPGPMFKMPKPYGGEKARKVLLPLADLRAIWEASQGSQKPFAKVIQLLLLTGCRLEEVGEAPWAEFDLANASWLIPGERTKNGQDHIVPLSAQALEVLSTIPTTFDYLFPARGAPRKPMSGWSKMKGAFRRLAQGVSIPDWTNHDLRKAVASEMEGMGIPTNVIEKALNHKSGSYRGIVGRYQINELLDQRRAALQAWADRLTEAAAGSSVVPIRA